MPSRVLALQHFIPEEFHCLGKCELLGQPAGCPDSGEVFSAGSIHTQEPRVDCNCFHSLNMKVES